MPKVTKAEVNETGQTEKVVEADRGRTFGTSLSTATLAFGAIGAITHYAFMPGDRHTPGSTKWYKSKKF